MNSGYVNAAIAKGVINPFAVELPADTLRACGALKDYPQPAHPALALVGARVSHAPDGTRQIIATLEWLESSNRFVLRQALTFREVSEWRNFVREIDRWTTQNVEVESNTLPTHQGTEFLRRLCGPYAQGPLIIW